MILLISYLIEFDVAYILVNITIMVQGTLFLQHVFNDAVTYRKVDRVDDNRLHL